MLVVVAIGGHALRDPRAEAAADDDAALRSLAGALSEAGAKHHLVITHGSGPQVGASALEGAEAGSAKPLDRLCAELQGEVGYRLSCALGGRLAGRPVASVVTQVVVDPADPSFARPSKPIGPVLDTAAAERLARRHGWTMGDDRGGRRRLIASPKPVEVVELAAVRLLVEAGMVAVCAGGGGIPVVRRADGTLAGVDAVIDKDHTASLLARGIGAEALVFLTDVEAVRSDWPPPKGEWLGRMRPAALRRLSFAEGSMAPKVAGACDFIEAGGRLAAIGAVAQLPALIDGLAGTVVTN
ncbi:MAG: carbamate kinase [Alphaproteobacteria bacterium]